MRLAPGAGTDRVDGVADGGILRARVAARPVDGAANRALVELVASELGVPPSRVAIVRGATSRTKLIEIEAIGPDVVRSRWPGIEV